MRSIEDFKSFVKNHSELTKFVRSGEMTWQKFYELYNLYGEDEKVWDEYLNKKNSISPINSAKDIPSITDIINMLKNIKPEVLQQNIKSIQKFLGFVSDFISDSDKDNTSNRNIYMDRPTHKMFED